MLYQTPGCFDNANISYATSYGAAFGTCTRGDFDYASLNLHIVSRRPKKKEERRMWEE